MPVRVAVLRESAVGERRVALVPEVIQKMVKSGVGVAVEAGAGTEAGYPDPAFAAAGATITPGRQTLLAGANIVVSVQPPPPDAVHQIPPGAIVVALMNAHRNLATVRALVDRKVTAFALELIPRITRAQSMDVLSSQATAAGYKAAILGADTAPRFLPMLTTAAGTIRHAKVLILGAGVAGLMAIATAHRLGALVEAYDVRRAAGEQVRSLGARFLELAINAEGQGGYARELTEEEKVKERAMVEKAVAEADLVITTANVPGRKAPRLVTGDMVRRMKPGSVVIDLAAESGGNCELTKPDERVEVGGVTILGPTNLPSEIPFHTSQMYAKNLQSFLGLLIDSSNTIVTNFSDEILSASLLTADGRVVHAPTRALLDGTP
jgi:proton-translocating NAD(P)+ transhydrogenase subunit alpha